MRMFLFFCAYAAYVLFWLRLAFSALSWFRAESRQGGDLLSPPSLPCTACAGGTADLLTFRRLFITNGWLWLGSWTFHLSFFLVIVGHLRFAMEPVPECIKFLQFPGWVAGCVLPISVMGIAVVRIAGREKYVSWKNMLLLVHIFAIAVSGLLMRFVFRTDLVAAKEFVLGIFTFTPAAIPGSYLFLMHFSLVLLIVPLLPSHILAAPLVMFEARRREKDLAGIMGEYKAGGGWDLGRKT